MMLRKRARALCHGSNGAFEILKHGLQNRTEKQQQTGLDCSQVSKTIDQTSPVALIELALPEYDPRKGETKPGT